jgi:uncharacterized protein (TIGR00106 family)
MPVLEISITPVGTDATSFSRHVSQAREVVEKRGLQYQITPMSTMVEGELDDLMSLVKEVHNMPFSAGVERVITNVTIDERRDKEMNMHNMVEAARQ